MVERRIGGDPPIFSSSVVSTTSNSTSVSFPPSNSSAVYHNPSLRNRLSRTMAVSWLSAIKKQSSDGLKIFLACKPTRSVPINLELTCIGKLTRLVKRPVASKSFSLGSSVVSNSSKAPSPATRWGISAVAPLLSSVPVKTPMSSGVNPL